MTLQQLEYILALETYRHFVTAAEHCHVTQPTLTMQVQKLEEEMGTVLFNRKKQPLEPTKAGEQILLKARQIMREVNQLKEMVSNEKEDLAGTFRIGVIPTVAPYLIPLFAGEFIKTHPRIQFQVEEMKSSDIISGLKNDKLDIGLLATPLSENQLREIPLYYEPFLLYVSPSHPLYKKKTIQTKDVRQEGLWILNQGHCFRSQVLNICNQKTEDSHHGLKYESGSIETLKRLIDHNSGYTLIPELSIQQDTDKKLVRRFEEPQPVREISLVTHNSFTKELLLDELRKSILSKVPATFKKNKRFYTVKWR